MIPMHLEVDEENVHSPNSIVDGETKKTSTEASGNGGESPFGSPKHGFKRSLEWSDDVPPSKKARHFSREEGRPMREVTSVFMTPSGIIQSAYEGKVAEPSLPQIIDSPPSISEPEHCPLRDNACLFSDHSEEEGRPMRELTSVFMTPSGFIYSAYKGKVAAASLPQIIDSPPSTSEPKVHTTDILQLEKEMESKDSKKERSSESINDKKSNKEDSKKCNPSKKENAELSSEKSGNTSFSAKKEDNSRKLSAKGEKNLKVGDSGKSKYRGDKGKESKGFFKKYKDSSKLYKFIRQVNKRSVMSSNSHTKAIKSPKIPKASKPEKLRSPSFPVPSPTPSPPLPPMVNKNDSVERNFPSVEVMQEPVELKMEGILAEARYRDASPEFPPRTDNSVEAQAAQKIGLRLADLDKHIDVPLSKSAPLPAPCPPISPLQPTVMNKEDGVENNFQNDEVMEQSTELNMEDILGQARYTDDSPEIPAIIDDFVEAQARQQESHLADLDKHIEAPLPKSPPLPASCPAPSPRQPTVTNKEDGVENNFQNDEVMEQSVELNVEDILGEARYTDDSPEIPAIIDDFVEAQARQQESHLADLDKHIEAPLPKSPPLPASCPAPSPRQPTVTNKEDGVENNFQNDEVMEQSVELNVEDILGEARYTDDSPEIPAITDDSVDAQARQEESHLSDLDKCIDAVIQRAIIQYKVKSEKTYRDLEDTINEVARGPPLFKMQEQKHIYDLIDSSNGSPPEVHNSPVVKVPVGKEKPSKTTKMTVKTTPSASAQESSKREKAEGRHKKKTVMEQNEFTDSPNGSRPDSPDVRNSAVTKMPAEKGKPSKTPKMTVKTTPSALVQESSKKEKAEERHKKKSVVEQNDFTDSSNGSPPEVHNSPVVKVPVGKEKPSKTTKMTVKTTPSASAQESSKRERAEERHKKKTAMEQNEFTDSPNGSRPDSPDVRNSAVTKMPAEKGKPSETPKMTVKTTPSALVQESSKKEKAEERHKKKSVVEQNDFTDSSNGSPPEVHNSPVVKVPVGKEKPSKTTKMTVKTTPSASAQESSKREKAEGRHKKKTVMEQNEFTDSPNGSRPYSPDVRNSAVTKMPAENGKPSKTPKMTVKTTPSALVQESSKNEKAEQSSKKEKAEERHRKKSVVEQNDFADSSNGSPPEVHNSPVVKVPVGKEKPSKTTKMTVKTTPSASAQESSKREKAEGRHKKKTVMEQNEFTDSPNGSRPDSPDVRNSAVTKMPAEKGKPSKTPKTTVKTTPSALVQESSKKEEAEERHKKKSVVEQNDFADSSNGSPPEVHNSPVVKVPVGKEKPSKTTKMTVKTTPSASAQESSKREKAEGRHKKKTVMEQNEFTDSPNGSRPDSPDVRNSAVTKMPAEKGKPSKTPKMTVKTTPSALVQESSKNGKAEERHKKKSVVEQNDFTDSSNGSPPEVHNSPVVKVPVGKEKPSKTTKMTVKTTPSASAQESSKREKAEERHKKKTVMERNEFTDSPNGSRPDSPDVLNSAVSKMPVEKEISSKTPIMTVNTTPSALVQDSSKKEKAKERHKKRTVKEQNPKTFSLPKDSKETQGRPAAAQQPVPVERTVITTTIGTVILDDDGNEIWICPTCNRLDDGSPMIGCDGCNDWYHWVCVNIVVPPKEEESWFCERCITKRKTTPVKRGRKKHKREK